MKNETARREIESLDYYLQNHTDDYSEESHTAMMMAIKALEQQPCDDAISREDAYKIVMMSDTPFGKHKGTLIRELPPVTPKQKYVKWIEHPEIETSTPEYLMFYECSECGDKQCFCKSDIHKKRFCSNCGAKMQESEDKE